MDFLAYAMGGLARAEGGEGGGIGAFLPLLLVLVVGYIVFKIIRKYAKKGLRESICDDCLIVYKKGEKFCKKCGNSLTEK